MPAQALTTLGGFVNLFGSDATLAADTLNTGGLWVGELPEDEKGNLPANQTFPIVVLVQINEIPEWNTDGQVVSEKGEYQFHVFHNGGGDGGTGALAQAEAVATHIKAVFDPTSPSGALVSLPLQNVTSNWIERTGYLVRLAEFRDPQGDPVFEVVLPYTSYVNRLI